jgi:hypothetical protein
MQKGVDSAKSLCDIGRTHGTIINQMRTKTLLLTAAISAVALTGAVAQSTNVYSANIVGYVNYVNPPGYRMIANPLNSTNNSVANIFANPPDYLSVFKRNAAGTGFDGATYDPDIPGWSNPTLTLSPGEGGFIFVPGAVNYTNTFVGEVVLNSTNGVPSGYSIRGSVVPQSGGIQTVLSFPVSLSDTNSTTIFRYNGTSYNASTWDPIDTFGWTAGEPSINVGEGFWIFNANAPKSWVRNFTVN